jgi:hypothetical protein
MAPSAVTTPLDADAASHTTAWVRVYRKDRPGSGYVQLWGYGTTIERLPAIRNVAEYGLLRSESDAVHLPPS